MSTVYRDDMATQGAKPFFIRQKNGCEVLTDDRTQKIILSRSIAYVEDIEQTLYSTRYYIKEGTGWVQVNNGQFYSSEEAFFSALRHSDAFTRAVREWENKDDMNGL